MMMMVVLDTVVMAMMDVDDAGSGHWLRCGLVAMPRRGSPRFECDCGCCCVEEESPLPVYSSRHIGCVVVVVVAGFVVHGRTPP